MDNDKLLSQIFANQKAIFDTAKQTGDLIREAKKQIREMNELQTKSIQDVENFVVDIGVTDINDIQHTDISPLYTIPTTDGNYKLTKSRRVFIKYCVKILLVEQLLGEDIVKQIECLIRRRVRTESIAQAVQLSEVDISRVRCGNLAPYRVSQWKHCFQLVEDDDIPDEDIVSDLDTDAIFDAISNKAPLEDTVPILEVMEEFNLTNEDMANIFKCSIDTVERCVISGKLYKAFADRINDEFASEIAIPHATVTRAPKIIRRDTDLKILHDKEFNTRDEFKVFLRENVSSSALCTTIGVSRQYLHKYLNTEAKGSYRFYNKFTTLFRCKFDFK